VALAWILKKRIDKSTATFMILNGFGIIEILKKEFILLKTYWLFLVSTL
jgi:hypothetical protein